MKAARFDEHGAEAILVANDVIDERMDVIALVLGRADVDVPRVALCDAALIVLIRNRVSGVDIRVKRAIHTSSHHRKTRFRLVSSPVGSLTHSEAVLYLMVPIAVSFETSMVGSRSLV